MKYLLFESGVPYANKYDSLDVKPPPEALSGEGEPQGAGPKPESATE